MTDDSARLLCDSPDELEVYVTRIAELTGIPAAHLEKDFWVTEVLRGAANASASTGCSVIFKGGTSLSKAHRLIERFSEDVDLIVVLPEGGAGARDTKLKAFVKAAEETTGVASATNSATVTKGVKRTATFSCPTTHLVGALKPGVLMELGTRGGALPHRRLPIQSLLAEHAESIDLPVDFAGATPLSILVLDPVRTLAEDSFSSTTPQPKAMNSVGLPQRGTTTTSTSCSATTASWPTSTKSASTYSPARPLNTPGQLGYRLPNDQPTASRPARHGTHQIESPSKPTTAS